MLSFFKVIRQFFKSCVKPSPNIKKIYLVAGFSQSGKDTFADYLKGVTDNSIKLKFAGALKEHVCKKYRLDLSKMEDNEYKKSSVIIYEQGLPVQRTVRQLLIQEGAKYRKIDKNYWIKKIIKKIKETDSETIFVSDFRFVNEYHYLAKQLSGPKYKVQTIQIQRFDKSQVNDESEYNLINNKFEFDAVLQNKTTFEDFIEKCKEWFKYNS
jgi:hypothetical protein